VPVGVNIVKFFPDAVPAVLTTGRGVVAGAADFADDEATAAEVTSEKVVPFGAEEGAPDITMPPPADCWLCCCGATLGVGDCGFVEADDALPTNGAVVPAGFVDAEDALPTNGTVVPAGFVDAEDALPTNGTVVPAGFVDADDTFAAGPVVPATPTVMVLAKPLDGVAAVAPTARDVEGTMETTASDVLLAFGCGILEACVFCAAAEVFEACCVALPVRWPAADDRGDSVTVETTPSVFDAAGGAAAAGVDADCTTAVDF
jgi:hypothetical protein